MRTAALALLIAVVGVLVSEPADAHRRTRVTVGVGFGFGYPYWGPWGPWGPWYYPPPYYYPAPVVIRSEPVNYIEQGVSQPADQGSWWYYCDTAKGYYPYVKECPSGWQRVPPAPPR
jgi:hypothetical protein